MSVTYDYFPHALAYAAQRCTRCLVQVVINGTPVDVDCNFSLTDQQYADGVITAAYEITGSTLIDTGGTATELRYMLKSDTEVCASAVYDINVEIPDYTRLNVNISAVYTASTV